MFYLFLNCYIPFIKDIIFWPNQWGAYNKKDREACNADRGLDMNNPNKNDDFKILSEMWINIFGTPSGASYQTNKGN